MKDVIKQLLTESDPFLQLKDILKQYDISLYNDDGSYRNTGDVLDELSQKL